MKRESLIALGKKFATGYRALGLILLNTVVLLLVVEAVSAVIISGRTEEASLEQQVEAFKARMLGLEYYFSQDWARAYWDEHMEVADRWRYQPYTIWRTLPYTGTQINISDDGLRATVESACGADSYRIYIFGGSTVWGFGSPDWGTLPSYLQDRINDNGLNACVVNYGEVGYNSTQELIQLMLLLDHGDVPDMVIFYDGNNDVATANRTSEAGQHYYMESIAPAVKGGSAETDANPLVEWLRGTATFRLIRGTPKSPEPNWAFPPFEPGFVDDVVNVYLRNIRSVELLADEYGFRFYAFVQPVLPMVQREYTDEEQIFMWDLPGGMNELFQEVYPRWGEAAEDNEHLYYFANIFDEQPYPIWIDFNHVTPWGNLAAAHEIFQVIRGDLAEDLSNE